MNNVKNIYGTIYCLTNEKQYFGQTAEQDVEKYLETHKWQAEHGSERYIHRAIRKHGWDNFKKEIICECGNKLSLDLMEDLCINLFSLHPKGYNLKRGGAHGKHLEKTIQKIKDIRKKYIKENPHFQDGEKNPMYGRHHSEESRKLISINTTGEKNPMYGVHMCGKNAPMYGKHQSEESRKLISDHHADVSGENNPNYGKIGENNPNFNLPEIFCRYCDKKYKYPKYLEKHEQKCKLK